MAQQNNPAETSTELITGVLLIIVFVLFLINRITDPLAMLLGGLILLGSGIYQTVRGWHVSLVTWIFGIIFFLGGIGVRLFLVAFTEINWVFIALAAAVAYFGWQIFLRRR